MNRFIILFAATSFWIPIGARAQWQEIFFDSNYHWLSDVKFVNNDTGYVCGAWWHNPYPGVILKTTNGGATWDTTQLCCFWPMSLSAVNENTIYACGQDGIQFKTLNGGQSWFWNGNLPPSFEDVSSIHFLNQDTGIAVRFNAGIWRTVDSTIWNGQQTGGHSSFPNTSSIQFLNDSIGFIANEIVLKTSDWGSTWQKLNLDSNLEATSIFMKNINDGIVIGKHGMVSLTFDGGITWTPTDTIASSTTLLVDVAFIDDSIGYIIGGNGHYDGNHFGKIYMTSDGGYNWTLMQSFSHSLTSLFFVNDSTGFAVGQAGRILKITNANKVSVSEIGKNNAVFLFPNPFHSSTTLKLLNLNNFKHVLRIYNLLGMLMREELIVQQSTVINSASLEPGVYFYQVTNPVGESYCGKLVID